ncbi:MAG: 1-(5-phosphoribosyl)-5-[(5-phosphoribosylamino) methylideneamino]imidazole-4-carboxamide isomerase [Armatimonadaceae bacterium]
MLEIIPAIDLRGGKAVRLIRGDFGQETRVAEDPVAVARGFAQQGAPRIHVVDLDGSRTGSRENAPLVAEIIRSVDVPVQVGGGIRSLETVQELLALGADRLIIGTSAAQNEAVLKAMLEKFAERLIIGADADKGFVAVHGWQETTGERAEDFCIRLAAMGAMRFLFTDISRDGMLEGVNAEATATLARTVGKPIIASGGVAGIEDIRRLVAVHDQGVEGVVIGKALYAGKLSLAEALEMVGQHALPSSGGI